MIWKIPQNISKWKVYKFQIAVVVLEIVTILFLISGLFGKNDVFIIDPATQALTAGIYDDKTQTCVIDKSAAYTGTFTTTSNLSLKSGRYKVEVFYECDQENLVSLDDAQIAYGGLLSDNITLFPGATSTEFDIWLLEDTDSLNISSIYVSEGYLHIGEIIFRQTNSVNVLLLLLFVTLFTVFDITWFYFYRHREEKEIKEKKLVLSGLILITLFSSVPLMVDYLIEAGDLVFHLSRIEGVADGLLAGQFPVRIYPQILCGHGYASSIMYGDLFLYIPAFLRILGLPLFASYNLFLFMINAATCLAAYLSFGKLFKNRWIGLFGSMLYTFSIYRLYNMYGRAAVGETLAMIFLPVLCYGMYRIFAEDEKEKTYQRNWIVPTIALTGMIQSHILSCEIVGIFIILLCVILIKKVIKPRRFLVLVKTVVATILLNAWFLVPFLDYILHEKLTVFQIAGRKIQYFGVYLSHLFFTFFKSGSSSRFDVNGMVGSDPIGLGFALCLGLAAFLYLVVSKGFEGYDSSKVKAGYIGGFMGITAAFMSTIYFPWDEIQSLGGIFDKLISSMQFPIRFLIIASVCFALVTCIAADCILKKGNHTVTGIFFATIIAFSLFTASFLLDDYLFSKSYIRVNDGKGMGSGSVLGGEYLPAGTDGALLKYAQPVAEEDIVILAYEKDGITVDITCKNTGDEEKTIEFPILYYTGYEARDSKTGDRLDIASGTNHVVSVSVPAGYEGKFEVTFEGASYWKVAQLVSLLCLLAVIGLSLKYTAFSKNGE